MADENASVKQLTAVITGANSGIGLAAAVGFAKRGFRLALVGRDQERLDQALSTVRAAGAPGVEVTAFRADFAVLQDVRVLAERLSDRYPRIDVLANNAGLVAPNRVTTVDDFELTIQANHLAPFLLTNLLRERLQGGRVVNTASAAHTSGTINTDDLSSERAPYKAFTVYGSSKQANILFAAEAARRWPDILSFSYHPGVVRTRFGRDSGVISTFYKMMPFLRSPEKGADTLLWLATTPAAQLQDGGYYTDRELRSANARASGPAVAAELWAVSEKSVGLS